jgi:hypothetical protein
LIAVPFTLGNILGPMRLVVARMLAEVVLSPPDRPRTAAGDVDGEDAGEELCPRDAPWPRRGAGRGSGRVVGEGEVQRELWRRRRCGGLGDDAL